MPAVDAAATSGRGPPRIVASVPVCVTDDADGLKEMVETFLASYTICRRTAG